ncbi:class I SAM-dependent methyltransferase [Ramlibacter sp.]|uniref:class I SAM-dependent methyltransferase n=1 Tax=Ramlibacter sp. TaxID=1917967 RepID=UPI003D0F7BFB
MTLVELAALPCNLCGTDTVTVLSTRSRSGQPLRSVACTGCGLVWSDPRPHEARKFYEHDYRLAYKGTYRPRARHVLRAGRVALDRLEKCARVLGPARRVLDVGSGGGEFAYLLKRLGHDVTGVEPNRGYAEHSREEYGLDVRVGFVGDVGLPAESFDVITIWHVLEHTEDPGAVLGQLRAALRPEGRLVVEVPNVEATCQSPRSSFHEAHLYTFCAATLARLGAKAGLEQVAFERSADGGNITMIFAPAAACTDGAPALRIPGNHAQVAAVVKAHTSWSHALSAHPWRRAADRLTRWMSETWALRRGTTGKALLDAMYPPQGDPATSPPAGTRQHTWGWLLAAYALAVAAEEVLLDNVVPAMQFGPSEGLAAYLGLQALVIGTLFLAFGRKMQSRRQLIAAGAWAMPLLAVPAIC